MLPHIFTKPGGDTVNIMNYLTTPMASSVVFKRLEQEMESTTSGQQDEPQAPGKGCKGRAEKGGGKGGKNRGRARAKKISKRKAAQRDAAADANDSQVGDGDEPKDRRAKWNSMAYPIEGGPERPKTAIDDFMHVTLEGIQKYEQRLRNRTSDHGCHAWVMSAHGISSC